MIPVLLILILLVALWIGLKVRPVDFPRVASGASVRWTPDSLDALPPPVARYYRLVADQGTPIVQTWSVSGQATLRLGVPFPARFRFVQRTGRDYTHIMHGTVFGIPVFNGYETFHDGHTRLELPFGVQENSAKLDQAANLSLWAETAMLPSTLASNPRVRWEAIDETSARLIVPFGGAEDELTARFDPQTGLIITLHGLRYQDANGEKIGWGGAYFDWKLIDGVFLPARWKIRWDNQKQPWSEWTINAFAANVDDRLMTSRSG